MGTVNTAPIHSAAESLIEHYKAVRCQSEVLCQPLEVEDYGVQAMPNVSPPKWHLAHTSWFFETFLLKPFSANFKYHNPHYELLFNSYYHRIGKLFPREQRGLIARPTVAEIYRYRCCVDEQVVNLVLHAPSTAQRPLRERLLLGLAHEQQHQELILTDIKYNFSKNPLLPSYSNSRPPPLGPLHSHAAKLQWLAIDGGTIQLGAANLPFCFDNELPRHTALLAPFMLASRPISNAEYRQFIDDGGYQRPELWLADGWHECQQQRWQAPLYWRQEDNQWQVFTLHGERPLFGAEPVCHVSYYEADAYARWADARLPTEAEWEHVAADSEIAGHFADDGVLQPRAAPHAALPPQQLFGDVWEWTASPYTPYPGFRAASNAIGEYNGKFMCNQMVLRGGSCATPREHIRASYRNFFYPADRWQFSGIRLARNVQE